MRRLLVCLLLLAPLGAACSSGGDDDADSTGSNSASAPSETEGSDEDTEAYCAKVQELVTFFEDNLDPELPPDEARTAFMVEFEDEAVALFVEAGSLAPAEIGGAFTAVLNSADNAAEAQATLDEFNQEECGVDSTALAPAPE